MIKKQKIAILSTDINFELYSRSSTLFLAGICKYVIDGRTGMYGIESLCYMMKKLKNKDIDWLIMADEDVLFKNPELIFPLITQMEVENIMISGVRDGGEILHRNNNPYVINTFFSIINFKELKRIWDPKEMLKHQYIIKGEFNDDLSGLEYDFNAESLYEPYYCFYFWLRRKGKKILFLDTEMPFEGDSIANSVKDLQGNTILYHTWYARSYGVHEKHTLRINKIFDSILTKSNDNKNIIIFKDSTFAFRKRAEKLCRRIANKIKKYK